MALTRLYLTLTFTYRERTRYYWSTVTPSPQPPPPPLGASLVATSSSTNSSRHTRRRNFQHRRSTPPHRFPQHVHRDRHTRKDAQQLLHVHTAADPLPLRGARPRHLVRPHAFPHVPEPAVQGAKSAAPYHHAVYGARAGMDGPKGTRSAEGRRSKASTARRVVKQKKKGFVGCTTAPPWPQTSKLEELLRAETKPHVDPAA